MLNRLDPLFQIFEERISFYYDPNVFMEKIINVYLYFKTNNMRRTRLMSRTVEGRIGNDELQIIFGQELFNKLIECGILTEKLLYKYNEILAIDDTDIYLKEKKMWYSSYSSRINILFAIISEIDKMMNGNISRNKIIRDKDAIQMQIENILKYELTIRIYQYIYYSNVYLKDENIPQGMTKEEMIEIAFEYVYYYHLNYYLDFCKMFLGCIDKPPPPKNAKPIGKGALGSVFEIEPGFVEKTLSSVRIERSIFEFFKNICLYEEFPENIAEPVLFTIGSNLLYIKMKKIDGQTLFDYIVNNKKFINLSNEDKYKIIKEISIKCSNILKRMQDTSDFIHYDFNLRNIIIDDTDDNINIYLLDFDKSLFKINNIYIFTFHQMLNINILKDNEFKKSIDLFRYISKFFTLLDDLKSYQEGYKNENNEQIKDFINKTITNYVLIIISNIFFGVNDNNIGVRIFKITGKYSWPTILSIYKRERYKVCKLLNRELISRNTPLYITNFIPNYFNKKWY
jgi:hypothetical protein